MFHSSVIPVGLPVSTVLGATVVVLLGAAGMAPAEILGWAKAVTAVSNIVAGGAKNLAMIDPASLLVVRPTSVLVSLGLVAAWAGGG